MVISTAPTVCGDWCWGSGTTDSPCRWMRVWIPLESPNSCSSVSSCKLLPNIEDLGEGSCRSGYVLMDPLELRELLELWLEMLERGLTMEFAVVPGLALPSWLQMLERGLAIGAACSIAPSRSWLTAVPYRESE